jgi:hypothetical protein
MKPILIAVACLIGLSGCLSESERSRRELEIAMRARYERPFRSLSSDEIAICETVFRHQFRRNASAAQQSAKAYFITVCANDPDPPFIERFRDISPAVYAGSKFKVGRGLAFGISTIELRGDTAVVSGGYYEDTLSSSSSTYRLEKKAGVWTVVSDEMNWISDRPNQPRQPTSIAVTFRANARPAPAMLVAAQ